MNRSGLKLVQMVCRLAILAVMAAPLIGAGLGFHPSGQAAARTADLQRIVGTYSVEGQNPNGTRYQGTATISLNGPAVEMRWNIAGEQFSGTGALVQGILTID
ncbi:hypothetical protein JM93_02463 [Roseibium hamelinense]|uniref:Uncharacterized protein n=1 Tax=Roseibium hamelinense TaxID=150831 RepID=A0A562T1P6_9HYPH|nr:hypothetical protein [Roseibium hamelinense]MTI44596.1 hypothetical protein [Roseibium hamelinense]TWI87223.1 hypothetical protein JM93_02463 [Roseibium hamelinense]